MDSSRAEVCSGEVPCLLGSSARASFSTYGARRYKEEVSKWAITSISGGMVTISEKSPYVLTRPPSRAKRTERGKLKEEPYRDFKINKLLGKRAHIVIKAESVLARLFRGEDEVALSLLLRAHDSLVAGTDDAVVDIERATRLNLLKGMHQSLYFLCRFWSGLVRENGVGEGILRQSRRPILHPFPPHSWRSKLSHWEWACRWGP